MIVNNVSYTGVGVYALFDDAGKVYIGSSKNVRYRIYMHRAAGKRGREITELQKSVDAGMPFRAVVLEKLPPSTSRLELRRCEMRHIKNARKNGAVYNINNTTDLAVWEENVCPLRPDLLSEEWRKGVKHEE